MAASFLNLGTALAALAAAIALPVVIHLLFRPRERIVAWAAMRFLPAVKKKRKRRVDHWPIFLARLFGILLCLLAMFAVLPGFERIWQAIRPGELETLKTHPRTHTVILLDCSLSLEAKAEDDTHFELAKQQALELIESAQAGDGLSLVLLERGATAVVTGPSNQFEFVRGEAEKAAAYHGPTELAAGLAAALEIVQRSPTAYQHRRVVLITDRQRSGFEGLLPSAGKAVPEIWGKLARRAELAIVDVGRDGLENLAVTGLSLAETPAIAGQPALLAITVKNHSRVERRDVKIELSLSRPGAPLSLTPVATLIAERLPAGGTANLFYLLEGFQQIQEEGPHVLQAALTATDALTVDNTRRLAFEAKASIKVLIVNGRPVTDELKRASEFVAEALVPGGRAIPGNPFEVQVISPAEFQDATRSDLAKADVLVLCDLPGFTPSQTARMEEFLKRGGGILLSMGPNAAANQANYNRLLGPEGAGYLPGTMAGTVSNQESGIHLFGAEASFREPPLAAFAEPNARAALGLAPFRTIVRFQTEGEPKRILSFVDAQSADGTTPDLALAEIPKHRGRVLVFASGLDREWGDWPSLPSFLPFVRVVVQYAAGGRDRGTVVAGEPIEEFFPADAVGRTATLALGEQRWESKVLAGESGGTARFAGLRHAGLYELRTPGQPTRPIAVNAESSTAGLAESELNRLDAAELQAINVPIQSVSTVGDLKYPDSDIATVTILPKPRGPVVAKWLALAGFSLLVLELMLLWKSSRNAGIAGKDQIAVRRSGADRLLRFFGWCLLLAVWLGLAVAVPASILGELPRFVPASLREYAEGQLNVPKAPSGEGTRWRVAASRLFSGQARVDRIAVFTAVAGLSLAAACAYWRERRTIRPGRALLLPFLLRVTAYALAGLVVLPQLRLVFEREGLPEIAVIVDTSASMGTIDDGQSESRLGRALALLLRDDDGLLRAIADGRSMRLSLYSLSERASLAASIDDPKDSGEIAAALTKFKAEGRSTRLGEGLATVARSHRGGNLAAVIVLSDGITTQGPELSEAAIREGVPVYAIGLGDRREPIDLAIADVKAEDIVARGDEWFAEVRVGGRGRAGEAIVVELLEKKDDRTTVLDSVTLPPLEGGPPATVKLKTRPNETGEKNWIVAIRSQSGERDTANNRAERNVLVTEGKTIRVLYVEGRPRYEFRFLKSLLEREVESRGGRALEFRFLLQEAGKDFATTDRGSLRAFPTRSELFEYDVIILGDIDPALLPRGPATLQDVAEFVRVRGGGLLVLAGEYFVPLKLFDTPLADVLPVLPRGVQAPAGSEEQPLTDGYSLKLTPLGRQHPLLRLSGEDAANQELWAKLPKLLWRAGSLMPRRTAELLAVHPDHTEAEPAPLIVQQFAGAGRCLFFAFDESWRWRPRQDEELYNRFWRQAVRVLARNRVARPEIRTESAGPFRAGEPVKLLVRFPDDAPAPSGSVRLSVERSLGDDREVRIVDLEKVPGKRAEYRVALAKTPEGVYRLKLLEPRTEGRAPGLEFQVTAPPGELDRLDLNARDLLAAAAESGGVYYTPDNADKLPGDLPAGARPPLGESAPPLPVWNLPIVFVTLLSLLGFEWLVRRRCRLI